MPESSPLGHLVRALASELSRSLYALGTIQVSVLTLHLPCDAKLTHYFVAHRTPQGGCRERYSAHICHRNRDGELLSVSPVPCDMIDICPRGPPRPLKACATLDLPGAEGKPAVRLSRPALFQGMSTDGGP